MKLNQAVIIYLFCVDVAIADTDSVDIKEWPVSYDNSCPRDPYVAPDVLVWFCGQLNGYIAVLNPDSGEFKKFGMEYNERPYNLIIDDYSIVWYAGNTLGYIGRLNLATGEIKKYPMPNVNVRDPHTLVFDSSGDIWFTSQQSNFIGKLFVETGEVRVVEVPTSRSRPYGIWMDSEDRPWVALFGTNKLATND